MASGSHAWRSILKARGLIKRGMLWQVGDGTNINIYADRWLPGEGSAKIISPQVDMAKEWIIAQLIDLNGGGWNDHLIDSLFLQFEAQRIKGIPLCLSRQEDCITWPRCKLGTYLVKLGYQVLCELESAEEALASSDEKSKSFWRNIWQLRVQNKVKIFLTTFIDPSLKTFNLVQTSI